MATYKREDFLPGGRLFRQNDHNTVVPDIFKGYSRFEALVKVCSQACEDTEIYLGPLELI